MPAESHSRASAQSKIQTGFLRAFAPSREPKPVFQSSQTRVSHEGAKSRRKQKKQNPWQSFNACVSASHWENTPMKNFTAVIERDKDTGLLVGFVPGFPGAHSQGATLNELRDNLAEVLAMLLSD
jgi:hypothetical protein